jgi:hypothetical protein
MVTVVTTFPHLSSRVTRDKARFSYIWLPYSDFSGVDLPAYKVARSRINP